MKHPVRLYLLLFFLVFPLVSVLSAEETLEQSAIALVERFLDRLEQETPWEYSEEESLFYAPVSSWVLMMQAGIMKEDGTWTEAEPKLSLFGQLLQSRRELFFFPDSEKQLIFSAEKNAETGSVILLYRKKKPRAFSEFDQAPLSKCIIFAIANHTSKGRIDPRIDLDHSFIDGRNLPNLLGFTIRPEKIISAGQIKETMTPCFPEEAQRKLLRSSEETGRKNKNAE